MNDLIELVQNICDAEYEYKDYQGEKTKSSIISRYDSHAIAKKTAIEKVVYEWANKHMSVFESDKRIAELEAKCYVYESIINNSNFRPIFEIKQCKLEEDK